jgi:hypothetical protein
MPRNAPSLKSNEVGRESPVQNLDCRKREGVAFIFGGAIICYRS